MYCIIQTLLVLDVKHRGGFNQCSYYDDGEAASSSCRVQTSTAGGGGARARRRASFRTQSRAPTRYVETPVKTRSHRVAPRWSPSEVSLKDHPETPDVAWLW